jgi:hypothetical protein
MASPEKVIRLNLDASKVQSSLESLVKALAQATAGVAAALKDVTTQINDIASKGSGKLAEGIGGGVADGVAQAKKELGGLQGAIEEMNQDAATRFELQVKNTVTQWAYQFEQLSKIAKQRFMEIAASKALVFDESSLIKTGEKGGLFEDPFLKGEFSRTRDQSKDVDAAAAALDASFKRAASSKESHYDELTRLDDSFQTRMEARDRSFANEQVSAKDDESSKLDSAFKRALSKKQQYYSSVERLEDQFNESMRGRDRAFEKEQIEHAAKLAELDQQFRSGSNARDSREAAAAVKAHNDAARELMGTHQNIGLSISQWILRLGTGIVMYRAIRDTVREIESLLSSFVKLGITHTQNQEKDLESLAGIVSANFNITDQQGKQLEGATRLSAVQDKASGLYHQIQEAAKNTAFSTEDLIQAYQQITEPAVRYKKTTDDILQLTVMTSSAARALGLNMKEAGTELAALLSGKGSGNKLATGLGLTAGEIELLKQLQMSPSGMAQAGAMWDRIVERMSGFAAQNANAEQSLASMGNRFSLIMGELSAGVEAPFFAAFKDFVRTAEQFLTSDDAKMFFSVMRGSGQGVLKTLQGEGASLTGGGVDGLNGFIIGVGKLLELLVQLFGFLARVTKGTVEWIGENELLIKVLGTLFAIYAGGMSLVALEKSIAAVAQGTSTFANVVNLLVGNLIPAKMRLQDMTVADEMLATGSASAATGVDLLKFALSGLVSATVIGGVIAFFAIILENLTDVIQHAKLAKQAMEEMAGGDFDAATQSSLGDFSTQKAKGNGVGAADASFRLSSIADDRKRQLDVAFSSVNEKFSLSAHDAADAYTKLIDRQRELDSALAKSKTPEQTAALRDQSFAAGKAASELKQAIVTVAEARRTATRTSAGALGLISPQISDDDIRGFDQRQSKTNVQTASTMFGTDTTGTFGGQDRSADFTNARVDALVRAAKQLWGDENKNRDGLTEAERLLDTIEKDSKTNATAKPGRPEVKYERDTFKDPFDDHVSAYKSMLAVQTKEDELAVAKRDMLQEQATKRQEDREIDLTAFINLEMDRRRQHFEAWQKEQNELPVEKRALPSSIQQLQERFAKEQEKGVNDAAIVSLNAQIGLEKRKAAFDSLLDQYTDSLNAKEDGITEQVGEKAGAQFQKMIDRLQAMRPATEEQKQARDEALARARGLLPRVEAHAENEAALRASESIARRLAEEEKVLGQRFEANTISAKAYASEVLRLQDAQRRNLLSEQAGLVTKRGEILSAPDGQVNQSALADVDARLASIYGRLQAFPTVGNRVRDSFQSWIGVLAAIQPYAAMFDSFTRGTSAFSAVLQGAVQNAGAFVTVMGQIKEAQAQFAIAKTAFGKNSENGGGFGGLMGSLGGAKDGVQATGIQKALGGLMIAGTAASIGIGIASAMFQRAVEQAKTRISDGINKVADEIKNGALSIGDGVGQLERQRANAIKTYSSSKSGRAALKEILPDIDSQIQGLLDKIKSVREAFDQKLQDSKLGSGPFADFSKMLIDLAKASKDYLDTFEQGTEDYAKAKIAINELYNNTLKSAKENLEQQMHGFETEALQSAQKIIDLMDQRSDLFDQLASLADQRAALEQQRADQATQAQRAGSRPRTGAPGQRAEDP